MVNSFDIETLNDKDKLIPYCISAIYDNKTKTFFGINCVNSFIEHTFEILEKWKIAKKGSKIIIFSHNLTFDGSILLQHVISSNNLEYDGLFVKGTIYSLTIIKNDLKIILKCSYKFFPTKLEMASKKLNTREKMDFNHNLININNFKEYEDKSKKYCLNDSMIVKEIIQKYDKITSKYMKDWKLHTNSVTSISYNIFKKNFNRYNIKMINNNSSDELIRQSYYGGRCEVFGNPKLNELIYHYDFSGMYAQIMHQDFCHGEYEIINNPNYLNKPGFYFIHYKSNNNIPILPHHSIINNKLMFTNGVGSGLYWWEEIELFEKHGGKILKIAYHIRYRNYSPVFKDFVSHFTKIRKSSEEANSIAKLIINSLYGRLGMGPIENETKVLNKESYLEYKKKNENMILSEMKVNEIYILSVKAPLSNEIKSNVELASAITAKARIKLYNGFMSTIENGGRVLYSDTDSIFAAFNKNVDNQKHGEIMWDINKKDTKIKKAIFAMPKAYALIYEDNKECIKIKGINRSNMDFYEFKNIFEKKSSITVSVSSLKKANYIITPNNIHKIINLNKYDKRIFISNYTETRPFIHDGVNYI